MSVFTPVNVEAPFDRKKQLVHQLMQQLQTNVGRATGLMGSSPVGMAVRGALGTGARPVHPYGGAPQLTQMLPSIAPALQRLLGPGGFGHPIPGRDSSSAPGMGIVSQLGATPHGGPPVNAPGVGQGGGAPISVAPAPQGNAAAAPMSSAPIPLGNGVFYDPVNEVLINKNAGPAAPTSGGSAGSRFSAV